MPEATTAAARYRVIHVWVANRKVFVTPQNGDGRLEVFVKGTDGTLLHAWPLFQTY